MPFRNRGHRRKKAGGRSLLRCCLCRNHPKESPDYAYEQAPLGEEEVPTYRMYSFSDFDLLPAVEPSEVLYSNVVPTEPEALPPSLPEPVPEPLPAPGPELKDLKVHEEEIIPESPPKAPRLLPKEEEADDEDLISPSVLQLMNKYQTFELEDDCAQLYSQVQNWILETGRQQRLVPPEAWVYTNILD